MLEINENIVYVKGALNGAVYDFNSGKVYSIDKEACDIIDKLSKSKNGLTALEEEYKLLLQSNELYDPKFVIKEYIPTKEYNKQLKLAWLEITQACNLRCLHCYEGENHTSTAKALSLEEWYRIIDEIIESKVQRVVVIGGEPCCSKNVKKILTYLAKRNVNTTLFTNGTLFDEELFETIIQNNILVKFSLYGHNAEVHDKITQIDGSFNKLVNTVKRLIEYNVRVDIAVVAMRENQDYQNEIREFIHSLNINYHGYDVIRNVFGGKQSEHTPDNIEIIKRSTFSEPSFYTSKVRFDEHYYKNSCWYGKFAVTEDGDVLPCVFERNISYGNVRKQSIKEIMNDSLLTSNWFRDFSQVSYCKDCEYRYSCKDCRPLALSCKGDINDKNPRCLYNPYTGKWGK